VQDKIVLIITPVSGGINILRAPAIYGAISRSETAELVRVRSPQTNSLPARGWTPQGFTTTEPGITILRLAGLSARIHSTLTLLTLKALIDIHIG
jgi:hypothetical protein